MKVNRLISHFVCMSVVLLLQSTLIFSATSFWFPVEEMTALHDLYISTRGTSWAWEEDEASYGSQWNFTQNLTSGDYLYNPCSNDEAGSVWQGITCSNTSLQCANQRCHVIQLNLDSYSLHGTVPTSLGVLKYLEFLDLANNRALGGSIPVTLGSLLHLWFIDLSVSSFVGSVPSSLQNLTVLQYLYLDHNFLTGPIPPQLCALLQLRDLYLDSNSLTGSLPRELGNLTRMNKLMVQLNSLTGQIPSEMGTMTQLKILYLYANQLTGSLPSELGALTELQYLIPYSNLLTGKIPSELGNLVNLRFLFLNNNLLTGHIPSELGKLIQMQDLLLYDTLLSGPLSPELGNMVHVKNFYSFFTMLTGSIPSEFGKMLNMQNFFLQNNFLTGVFPPELGAMTDMRFIYLDFNALTGTIPNELSAMEKLELVYLNSNSLSGSIPRGIGAWKQMSNLYLDQNMLTGEIPSELGDLVQLTHLYLYDNHLTGGIPSELTAVVRLEVMYLDRNSLSGSIPMGVGTLTQLKKMNIFDNMLTGSIPTSIGNIFTLQEINLFNNYLEHSVPTTLSNCTALGLLRLQHNLLTGPLQGIFHMDMIHIQNVDLSDNKFSGSIPKGIFELPIVSSVALSRNCFEGSLPAAMCDARNVSVLSMDGLGAAKACKGSVELPLSGVTLFNTLEGSIPSCVWVLPLLQVLHLTGNGLTGSVHISETETLGPVLTTISLGTIPTSLQERGVMNLDLSYNKFTGRYDHVEIVTGNSSSSSSPSASALGSLLLRVNRLSGRFPSTTHIVEVGELDVLGGNLFGCDNIPPEEEFSDEYSCGSEELDVSLYIFMSITALASLLVCLLHVMGGRCVDDGYVRKTRLYELFLKQRLYITYIEDYMSGADGDSAGGSSVWSNKHVMTKIRAFSRDLSSIKTLFWVLVSLFLVTSIPLYGLKLSEYGLEHTSHTTHSYQYRWVLTAAYMRGDIALVLLLLMWVIVVSSLSALTVRNGAFRRWLSSTSSSSSSSSSFSFSLSFSSALNIDFSVTPDDDIQPKFYKSKLKLMLIFVANASIVGSVCGIYIYFTSQSLPPSTILALQICMALFNLGWNMAVVPILSRPMDGMKNMVWTELWLLMFNNILLPSVITALTSPVCFQGLLVEPEEVTSTYEYEYCMYQVVEVDGSVTCRDYGVQTVEVVPLIPPFSYNNLCSSVLLTSFIPVYILVSSFQALVPLIQVCLFTSSKYTSFPKPLRKVLFGIFWPDYWKENQSSASANGGADDNDYDAQAEPLKLLKSNRIITTDILCPLLIFCTFGISSPFLALIMLVSVSLKHHMWLLMLGRFVHTRVTAAAATAGHDSDDGNRGEYGGVRGRQSENGNRNSTNNEVEEVNKDQALVALSAACVPIVDIVARCVWPVIWSSASFFAFLCWDVLGDEVGWKRALWAPCLVLALPLVLWMGMGFWSSGYDNDRNHRTNSLLQHVTTPPATTSSTDDEEIRPEVGSNPLHHAGMTGMIPEMELSVRMSSLHTRPA